MLCCHLCKERWGKTHTHTPDLEQHVLGELTYKYSKAQ